MVVGMTARTFAIGDVHGDLAALDRLLDQLRLGLDDTLVFLGDYIDRGPHSAGVVARVQELAASRPDRTVLLRGNHEDAWIESWEQPNAGFLLPRSNGCLEAFRSFTGSPAIGSGEDPSAEEFMRMVDVRSWLPESMVEWMRSLPLWYEDEHAIYVHAGLEGEGTTWKHPRESVPKALLWMREPDFYTGYSGKQLVFGHTLTKELPTDHLGRIRKLFGDPGDVWVRGDLIGIDTGAGKGGFLSAVELPRRKVYESR